MQYNQMMTDIVFAIRAQLPPIQKQTIKTSNPELLGDLADIYHSSHDLTLRMYIEQLMSLAGSTWLALLQHDPISATITNLHKTPTHTNSLLSAHEAVA